MPISLDLYRQNLFFTNLRQLHYEETTTREQTNKQTKDDSILYHIVEQFFSGSRKLIYVCFSFHFSELDKWVNYLLRLEHSEQICCRKHHTLH